jgi:hypothetical protein
MANTAAGPPPGARVGPQFSWDQYRRNREYKALVGTVAGFALLWLRGWLRMRWGY